MTWTTPDKDVLNEQIFKSRLLIDETIFGKDVILMGGSGQADNITFTPEESASKFFVQLNHHLIRRTHQPCDWLIARAGSGMCAEKFALLPQQTQDRIKFISCACNKHTFETWVKTGKPVYPFHEIGYASMNPFHFALEWCNQFWTEIKSNPFVGLLALRMILLFPVKSVTLYGFDFFALQDGSKRTKLGCHYIQCQMDWLKHQYLTDFRINLEPKLVEIIGAANTRRGINAPFEV